MPVGKSLKQVRVARVLVQPAVMQKVVLVLPGLRRHPVQPIDVAPPATGKAPAGPGSIGAREPVITLVKRVVSQDRPADEDAETECESR